MLNKYFGKIVFEDLGKLSLMLNGQHWRGIKRMVDRTMEISELQKEHYTREDVPLKDKLRIGASYLKDELQMRLDPTYERYFRETLRKYLYFTRAELGLCDEEKDAVYKILWRFENTEDLNRWIYLSDRDTYHGWSTCSFAMTQSHTGLFSGYLDTRIPQDGVTTKSGYCSVLTKKLYRDSPYISAFRDRKKYYDWTGYTHLLVKCRGDGRSYMLNLHTPGHFDLDKHDMYHYPLYTRGGPYWQISRIPFTKFFFGNKGITQDKQCKVPVDEITQIGITCSDRKPGAFSLEIDYIGVVYDQTDENVFDYEMYETKLAGLS